MTLAVVTLAFLVVGIPLIIGFVVAKRSIKQHTLARALTASLLSIALSALLLLIPGYVAAAVINCSVHPGPDCEHFDDPCLRAFWTSENGNWMEGDRHSCPGHV